MNKIRKYNKVKLGEIIIINLQIQNLRMIQLGEIIIFNLQNQNLRKIRLFRKINKVRINSLTQFPKLTM